MLKRLLQTLWLKALHKLQSRCVHPDYAVKADIQEGDSDGYQTEWCEVCGAFRFYSEKQYWLSEWRSPRPDWYTPKEREQYRKDLAATIAKER